MRRSDPRGRDAATYQRVSEDLRRCLTLGDIAAAHGNGRRAAEHLVEGLRELGPELRELQKAVLR